VIRRVRHAAWIASVALAATASAQQPSADDRLAGRLDGEARVQVVALVDSLRAEGLPTEPIVDRALEGVSKRADGALIVKVVRGFATHLRTARAILGPASPRELIAGANALKAGIKADELTRVRAMREGARYAVAFDVLTGLKNRNVPNDTAVRVIGALVKLAANDQQYVTLLDQIDRAIAGGVSPAIAASVQGIGVEKAVIAAGNNSGGLGATLPSGRGAVRTDPSVSGTATGAAATSGIPTEGAGAPAPRGKSAPKTPRKP
jgi:hypothetical protein